MPRECLAKRISENDAREVRQGQVRRDPSRAALWRLMCVRGSWHYFAYLAGGIACANKSDENVCMA